MKKNDIFMKKDEVLLMRKKGKARTGFLDLCDCLPQKAQVVEIGSYAGESALLFLQSQKIKNLYCIDPWKSGYDVKDGASFSSMKDVERKFDDTISGHSEVFKIKMPSIKASAYFSNETLDMVYLDGNHTYEAVLEDIRYWYPKVKLGGFLAGHDYKWAGVKKAILNSKLIVEKTFRDGSWLCVKTENSTFSMSKVD